MRASRCFPVGEANDVRTYSAKNGRNVCAACEVEGILGRAITLIDSGVHLCIYWVACIMSGTRRRRGETSKSMASVSRTPSQRLRYERALTIRDSYSDDEERWITLGVDACGRLLVVVYTWRG